MKLKNLVLTCLLGAGSLQASIVYQQATGLGLSAGAGVILQNFTSPSPTVAFQGAVTGSPDANGLYTSTSFSGVTLTANTGLYWDPNGSNTNGAECSLGKGVLGSTTTLSALTGCVGNYQLQNVNGGQLNNQAGQNGTPVGSTNLTAMSNNTQTNNPNLTLDTPELTIGFATPVYNASFVFATPGNATNTVFTVTLFNGSTQVGSSVALPGTLAAPDYLVITGGSAFNSIVIQQQVNSATTGEGTTSHSFNALIGDLDAQSTPEPATLGLLGIGLAGIGFFARRRKA